MILAKIFQTRIIENVIYSHTPFNFLTLWVVKIYVMLDYLDDIFFPQMSDQSNSPLPDHMINPDLLHVYSKKSLQVREYSV